MIRGKTLLKPALWLCLTALALCVVVFPEVYLKPGISFLWWNDYLCDYHETFVLAGFLYQGGIQLWDFFGQMPHAFNWVTFGMFKLPNILAVLGYWVISPFTQNSAMCFQQVFSFIYPATLTILRALGIFLILWRLSGNRWVTIAGSVIASVFFTPAAFMFGIFYQSIYPLAMYFIFSFFLTYQSRYLLAFLFVMVFSFSQNPIHTCYMYLGLQFFIYSCLGWSLFHHPGKARQWLDRLRRSPRQTVSACVMAGIIFAVILLPYIYMQTASLKDYEFGSSQSRISNIWSMGNYFHKLPLDQADPRDLFRRTMDFTYETGWSFFLGYMLYFLGLTGLVLSADRRKWIFALTLLMVWFINFPREGLNIGLLGHWINALANPFKTFVRSYHMASHTALPYLLIPLACLGLNSLIALTRTDKRPRPVGRWFLIILLSSGFVITSLRFEPPVVKNYLIFSLIVSTGALSVVVWGRTRMLYRLAGGAVLLLIALDMFLGVYQDKSFFSKYCEIRPHLFRSFPRIATAGIDYQNPKILPFIEKFDYFDHALDPELLSMRGISATYSRVINEELLFLPPGTDGHNPRHTSFANWFQEPWMRTYIDNDNRMFSFVPYAVESRPGLLKEIVGKHLSNDVSVVEGPAPALLSAIPAHIEPRAQIEDQWAMYPNDISDAGQHMSPQKDMFIWDFPLPGLLPPYIATTIFTQDRMVRFFIQLPDKKMMELEPVQGWLVRPYTFDVQNIKEGKVFVALPSDLRPLANARGILLIRNQSSSGVSSVWQHQSDQTGFFYDAPYQGWLRIRFPYDPKWHLTVDDKPSRFYRVDESFIGVPLEQGRHKVHIQYWPHSWLRWSIFLSALTAMACFFMVIGKALGERFDQ